MPRVAVAVVLLLPMVLGLAAPAAAADPSAAPTSLTLTGPGRTVLTGTAHLVAALRTADTDEAVAGELVRLERADGDAWAPVATQITDADGGAAYDVRVATTHSRFRVVYDGSDVQAAAISPSLTVTGFRRTTTVRLRGTWHLVDERSRTLHLLWRSHHGDPIPGTVRIYRRSADHGWHRALVRHLGLDGRASFTVAPRRDTRWKAVGLPGPWWRGDRTGVHRLDNRPPGRPVAYPRAAPRPRPLPPQAHAVGGGPNPTVSRIPDRVWRSMVGRSWHRGCPVGRAGLRLVRVNYWDFDGYRRRGEIVVRASIAGRTAAAFADMYRGRFPIRAMYRPDRFGWSSRVHGADDFAAMAHDDTDAFNCRSVSGMPGRTSPHSYGTAIDINTFENPYHSAVGVVPDRWWAGRSHPRIAWRSRSHPVVRIWLRHGFHWTYGVLDSQHMDARHRPVGGSFVAD